MEWNKLSPHLRHLSQKDQERVHEAHALGMKSHEGQTRKSGEPYFTHPVAVAIILADMHADADTLIAALLHDTVEDTDLTLEEIDAQFNGSVRGLIDGVTKLEAEDLADKPTLNEQTETLRKMFTLMKEDVRIMVIKLVDRLHNMQTVGHLSQEKQQALARETADIYVKIAERLSMQDLSDQLEHLCIAVLEPGIAKELEKLRVENERRGHGVMQSMKLALQKTTPDHLEMRYEVKTWEKLREQMIAEHVAVTGLSNVTAAFLAYDEEACYRILGLLHRLWRRETLSFQDFINSPAVNGYKGLHTTVILEDGTRVRCKIRTKEMHEYARRGIAALCFDSKASGVEEYLPWTARIGPLTKDMADRSREFWESLQSDILGESIVVHGAGDLAISLPEGSTALDGVFYCFHEKALRTEAIKVDGKEVPFSAPLRHGVSLNITLAKRFTVQREWLRWVNTGVAAAKIREALAMQSERKKYAMGKDILQKLMHERRKGYIEEFDRKNLALKLHTIGYSSIEDAYTAIADGRLRAEEVFKALFVHEDADTLQAQKIQHCIVQWTMDENEKSDLSQLWTMLQKQSITPKRAKLEWRKDGGVRFSVATRLSSVQREELRRELLTVRAIDIEIIVRTHREIFLIATVILLWGLNPVVAKWLLISGMPALTLMTFRLIVFSVFTTIFFFAWKLFSMRGKLSPLPNRAKLALLPAIGHIGMSLYYLALHFLPPSVHLTILRFNTLLLPGGDSQKTGKKGFLAVSTPAFMLFIGTAVIFFATYLGMPDATGLIFSLSTLFFYTFYSLSTERALHQHKIDIRHPHLLFQVGIYSGIAGLLLLPFQGSVLTILTSPLAIPTFLYVIFCVCLSQALYSALLKTTQFKHITDLFLLEIPLVLLLEFLLLGIALSPIAYIVVTIVFSLLVLVRWNTSIRNL